MLYIYSEEFFKEAGQVVDVRLGITEYGRFLGVGEVEFATAREAQKVLIVSFFFFFAYDETYLIGQLLI